MKTKKQKKGSQHSAFWALIKNIPGYQAEHKELIKEGIVHEYSRGKTTSLSEMYRLLPAEYSMMIEALKGNSDRRSVYDEKRDRASKRVIASICSWLDKLGYQFETSSEKIRYAKAVACRASNCSDFNKIPESRLAAIYNLYCNKNKVDISGNPALDYIITKN